MIDGELATGGLEESFESIRFTGIGLSRWDCTSNKGHGIYRFKFPLDPGTDRCCYHDGEFHRGVAIIGTNSQAIKTSLSYKEVT